MRSSDRLLWLGRKVPPDGPVLGPCSGPHSGQWLLFYERGQVFSVWSVKGLSLVCPKAVRRALLSLCCLSGL